MEAVLARHGIDTAEAGLRYLLSDANVGMILSGVASIDELQEAGRFREAVKAINEFLATPDGQRDDLGLKPRAETLERMLQHLAVADQLRAAGRRVAALEKFDLAVKLVPGPVVGATNHGQG